MMLSIFRTVLLSVVLTASLLFIAAQDAKAYCLAGTNFSSPTIPVYIHPDLPPLLEHDDGSAWSSSELWWVVERAIESINRSGAGVPPLYLAGWSSLEVGPKCGSGCTSCGSSHKIDGAIHIVGNCDACATGHATWSNDWGVVLLGTQDDCNDWAWEQWGFISNADTERWLVSSLLHEMGHCIGLGHPGGCTASCETTVCSVMGCGAQETWDCPQYYWDDVNGLYNVYGSYGTTLRREHWESSDGDSWFELSTAPPVLQPMFGASSSGPLGDMYVGYRDINTFEPGVWEWDWSAIDWTHWGISDANEIVVGQMGVAHDTSRDDVFNAYLAFESTTDTRKAAAMVKHTSATGSFSPTYSLVETTRRQGTSAAYDPKSDLVVQIWSRNASVQKLQLYDPVDRTYEEAVNLWRRTFGPPSVACASGSIYRNCLVVFTRAARGKTHVLQWYHFRIVTESDGSHSFDFGSLFTSSEEIDSPPKVAWRDDGSNAFVVAWSENHSNGRVYTAVKSTSETASWVNKTAHNLDGSGGTGFAIGSANNDFELLEIWYP